MHHGTLLALVCSIWVVSELLVMVLKHARGNASRRDRGSLWLLWGRHHDRHSRRIDAEGLSAGEDWI